MYAILVGNIIDFTSIARANLIRIERKRSREKPPNHRTQLEGFGNPVTKIDKLNFGWITLDGRKHRHDIVIFPDDEVKNEEEAF